MSLARLQEFHVSIDHEANIRFLEQVVLNDNVHDCEIGSHADADSLNGAIEGYRALVNPQPIPVSELEVGSIYLCWRTCPSFPVDARRYEIARWDGLTHPYWHWRLLSRCVSWPVDDLAAERKLTTPTWANASRELPTA